MSGFNDLLPLPVPVTFVSLESELWPDVYPPEKNTLLNPYTIASDRLGRTEACWVILTYLHLKQRNLDVRLSNKFIPGELCVVNAGNYFPQVYRPHSSFIVGCRGDCSRSSICNMTIAQNNLGVQSKHDMFMPHWPQPGLLPRNLDRGTRIETIIFNGSGLPERFQSPQFLAALKKLGVRFLNNSKEIGLSNNWSDYREADVVLAIRDHHALAKPASKLVNSWQAGVPALLGNEPAFREQRQSNLDYIEVREPSDVLEAVRYLKANPDVYMAMIQNGLTRSQEFSFDNIALRWRNLLAGEIYEEYCRWKEYSESRKKVELAIRKVNQQIVWKKEKFATFLIENATPMLPKFLSEKAEKSLNYWAFR